MCYSHIASVFSCQTFEKKDRSPHVSLTSLTFRSPTLVILDFIYLSQLWLYLFICLYISSIYLILFFISFCSYLSSSFSFYLSLFISIYFSIFISIYRYFCFGLLIYIYLYINLLKSIHISLDSYIVRCLSLFKIVCLY